MRLRRKKNHCAVPENIHTPPTEGIGLRKTKKIKEMKLNWNFWRGRVRIFSGKFYTFLIKPENTENIWDD